MARKSTKRPAKIKRRRRRTLAKITADSRKVGRLLHAEFKTVEEVAEIMGASVSRIEKDAKKFREDNEAAFEKERGQFVGDLVQEIRLRFRTKAHSLQQEFEAIDQQIRGFRKFLEENVTKNAEQAGQDTPADGFEIPDKYFHKGLHKEIRLLRNQKLAIISQLQQLDIGLVDCLRKLGILDGEQKDDWDETSIFARIRKSRRVRVDISISGGKGDNDGDKK